MSIENTNRHIVDQLADAKEEKEAANAKYDQLRDWVLTMGDYVGDEYIAQVSERNTTRLDRAKVEKLLTKAQFESCLVSSPSTVVKILKKSK